MPGTLPKPLTREALEYAWWDDWWAEDFSWEGLAEKKIAGTGGVHGEKTLQEYWRRGPDNPSVLRDNDAMLAAGELVYGPGRKLWHLAHVPLTWNDGSGKNGAAAKSDWNDAERENLRDILRRRIMAGCETKGSPVHIEGADSRTQLRGVVLTNRSIELPRRNEFNSIHLNCQMAWIDSCDFTNRTFGPLTSFQKVIFCELTSFYGATFSGITSFHNAAFFGSALFDRATFLQPALFLYTTFSGEASFERSRFQGPAMFHGMKFPGRVNFEGAVFEGQCGFSKLDDKSTEIHGDAEFRRTKFAGDADFGGVQFHRVANSWNAEFEDKAFFHGAKFGGQMRFEAARFAGIASFREITWPERALDWHKAFDVAVFSDVAQFQGAGPKAFAAFDGAVFKHPVSFDPGKQDDLDREFKIELDSARAAPDSNISLAELERGCRVLKKAMADASDKTREHMFYRFELMARNARSDIPWPERFASCAYETVSDYGTSILRPWLWLFVVAGYALGLYFFIGVFVAPEKLVPWQWLWDALDLSLSRVFQPLTFWSAANQQDNALGMELIGNPKRGLLAFFVRVLGTVQSLLSIILLFLSGLALRRRFQIN